MNRTCEREEKGANHASLLGNDSSSVEEVAVVEMMVIVEAIAKVNIDIGGSSFIDDTTPVCLIGRKSR